MALMGEVVDALARFWELWEGGEESKRVKIWEANGEFLSATFSSHLQTYEKKRDRREPRQSSTADFCFCRFFFHLGSLQSKRATPGAADYLRSWVTRRWRLKLFLGRRREVGG